MKTRLSETWSTLVGSLWFLPALMTIASVILSNAMLWIDAEIDIDWGGGRGLIYSGGVAGGREVLSTIAGSMMTVTGVMFSITIVTLSLASSQYGPRLLRNFLSDRGNQLVLGIFIGTFTYCLLVLRTLRDGENTTIVPELSITVGVLLALIGMAALIYFIHHISESIQASAILSGVGHDLERTIENLYPEMTGEGEGKPANSTTSQPGSTYGRPPQTITVPGVGYVRAVDSQGLMSAACEYDVVIRLECRPGGFVYRDSRIGTVWSNGELDDELVKRIRAAIFIGDQRTTFQDIHFSMSQLVQAALIALSPGVNNSLVAITAIDWMGATVAKLARREPPSDYRYDDDGNLRVITESVTFAQLFDSAFNPVRESARTNTIVTLHLLDTIISLVDHVTTEPQRQTLLRQATLIEQDSQDGIPNEYDRSQAQARYREIQRLLAKENLEVPTSPPQPV